jgi:hypothetical protein
MSGRLTEVFWQSRRNEIGKWGFPVQFGAVNCCIRFAQKRLAMQVHRERLKTRSRILIKADPEKSDESAAKIKGKKQYDKTYFQISTHGRSLGNLHNCTVRRRRKNWLQGRIAYHDVEHPTHRDGRYHKIQERLTICHRLL